MAKGNTQDFVKPHFLSATMQRRYNNILSNLISNVDTPPTDDTNTLRHFPAELVLLIAECLDTVDFLSFRATYRWHYYLVKAILPKAVEDTVLDPRPCPIGPGTSLPDSIAYYRQRDGLTIRFYRDRFRQFVEVEVERRRLGQQLEAALLCSYCLDRHSPSSFSVEERKKGPHERVCIGVQATLYICLHSTLTFGEIMATLRSRTTSLYSDPPDDLPEKRVLCTEPGCTVL